MPKRTTKEELEIFKKIINTRGLPEETFSLVLNFADLSVAATALSSKSKITKLSGMMLLVKIIHETFEFIDLRIMPGHAIVKPSSLIVKEWERLTTQNREAIKFIKSLRNTASHYDSNEIRGKLKQIRKFDDNLTESEFTMKLVSVLIFGKVVDEVQLKDTVSEVLIVISKMSEIYLNSYFPQLIKTIASKTKEEDSMKKVLELKGTTKVFFNFLDDLKNNFDMYWTVAVNAFNEDVKKSKKEKASDDIS